MQDFRDTIDYMENIELPRRKIYPVIDPPDFNEWVQQVKKATKEELLKKEQLAHEGLCGDGDGVKSKRWGRYFGAVTEEMRNRGL
jgi:hypothetical protein